MAPADGNITVTLDKQLNQMYNKVNTHTSSCIYDKNYHQVIHLFRSGCWCISSPTLIRNQSELQNSISPQAKWIVSAIISSAMQNINSLPDQVDTQCESLMQPQYTDVYMI